MMSTIRNDDSEDEYSVIGDKGEIGFIDFEDNKSVSNYDPMTEGPVYISVPFPFVRGKPQSVIVGETSKCAITIENTTNDPVELWAVKIFCSNPTDSFTLSLMEPPSMNSRAGNVRGFFEAYFLEDRVLQPYERLNIWLFCKPKEMGLHTTVVHFDAGDDRIERVVFLLAEDNVSQSLAPNRQYSRAPMRKGFSGDLVPNRPNSRFPTRKQFSGGDSAVSSRTDVATTHYFKYKLPKFPIPTNVRESLQDNQIPEVVMEGLCGKNYASFFKTLLIMEELRLEEDMRCHNMEWVSLRKKGSHLLALEVPGLAERRPSLVNGDHVFVKLASDYASDNTVYKGYIYRVEADEVLLQFPKALHDRHQNGSLYSVQFAYNRVNMRRLYQAVEATESLDPHLLFPSLSTKRRLVKATEFVPFTRNVNEEQMRAVKMILGCKGAPPYVIYGPPGTGKTMTLVEAMLQVHATRKSGRILVCAASNSAADHILEKMVCNELAEVKEREIFRLNATSRPYEDVHPDHIRFCYFEDSIFRCPPLMALQKYSIIICTYMSSSLLYAEGVSRGHFSHIFLDESGQASEPECMVPISSLCTRETVIVLAGDPKQLGPVVHSKDAERFGLGKSYLERLFECEFYKNEEEEFVTKLVRNYRCHRAILDLPSKLFYKGELIAAKECTSPSILSDVNFLPNKEFPVLFIGIQGCDEREGNNPSWFNRIEASKVVEIINKLRTSTDISEADIGVITPYRQQVLKIKTVLESKEMSDVKVGSVEQFQGQEREVIIVSTVRSTVKHNDFDTTYCLGFLSNPKRFNVAITRAKALLVIIGNPHIITKDPYWEKLLWLCADNNSYQGCPLPERRYIAEKNLSSEVDDSCHSKVKSWVESMQQDIPEIPKLIISDEAGQY